MKSLNDHITGSINEALEYPYEVAFLLPGVDTDDLTTFRVMVPAKLTRAFEKFLEEEEGNTIYHAYSGDGKFEI